MTIPGCCRWRGILTACGRAFKTWWISCWAGAATPSSLTPPGGAACLHLQKTRHPLGRFGVAMNLIASESRYCIKSKFVMMYRGMYEIWAWVGSICLCTLIFKSSVSCCPNFSSQVQHPQSCALSRSSRLSTISHRSLSGLVGGGGAGRDAVSGRMNGTGGFRDVAAHRTFISPLIRSVNQNLI